MGQAGQERDYQGYLQYLRQRKKLQTNYEQELRHEQEEEKELDIE